MYNSITKKQNRLLLVSLAVTIAAIAILIAITGSANKKAKNPTEPPVGNMTETDRGAPETSGRVIPDKIISENNGIPETTDLSETSETEASAEPEDDTEVSSVQQNTDILPTFSSPVDNFVIKGFSVDVPVFSYTMNDYRTHNGLDFACSPGTPVLAAADGTVCEIVDDPMMGVTIALQHTGGAVTKYKGLSEDSMDMCSVGDTVQRGQVIGASGDTALIESAEEDHLHFELYVNGDVQNPAEYMTVTYLSDVTED